MAKKKKKKKQLAKALKSGNKITKKEVKQLAKIGVSAKQIKKAANKAGAKKPPQASVKNIVQNNPPPPPKPKTQAPAPTGVGALPGQWEESPVSINTNKPKESAVTLVQRLEDQGQKLTGKDVTRIADLLKLEPEKVVKLAENKTNIKIGANALKLKDGEGKGKGKDGLESIDTKRNKELYDRGMEAIGEKVAKYEKKFSNEDYLKKLRRRATKRMKIEAEEYGREQQNPSLAMRYDKGKKSRENLFKDLRKPLTDALSSKSNLSMFEGDKIDFSEKKMSSFVDSGSDLFADIKSAAGELGYKAQANPANRAKAAAGRIKKKPAVDSVASLKSKLYKKPTLV